MAFKVTLRKSERSPVWSRVSGNYRVFRSSGFLRGSGKEWQNSPSLSLTSLLRRQEERFFWEEGSTLNVVARVYSKCRSKGESGVCVFG